MLHSLENTLHNKSPSKDANPQHTQGSTAWSPQPSYPFCDSVTDLGKKIIQKKGYPHVAFQGLHYINQTPLLAEEPLLHNFLKNFSKTTQLLVMHKTTLPLQTPVEERIFYFFRHYKK